MSPRRKASRSGRPLEAFLSHSSKDRQAADRLAKVLTDHGIPVWYSQTELVGAQEWYDEIGEALARCDWFIILLSPNALKAPWVKRELVYALNDKRYKGRILPVLHRPCDYQRLLWALAGYQAIDFQRASREGCRLLLKTWGIGYRSVE